VRKGRILSVAVEREGRIFSVAVEKGEGKDFLRFLKQKKHVIIVIRKPYYTTLVRSHVKNYNYLCLRQNNF